MSMKLRQKKPFSVMGLLMSSKASNEVLSVANVLRTGLIRDFMRLLAEPVV